MDVFKEYFKSERGLDVVDVEGGFIAFSIKGQEFYLEEIFVAKEKRMSPLAYRLYKKAEVLARANGCVAISGIIDTRKPAPVVNKLLKMYQKLGFQVTGAENGYLVILNDIREDS